MNVMEISKVKDLVKFVTGYEGRKLKFEKLTLGLSIDHFKDLWLNFLIKWNSIYKMLRRTLLYHAAFTSMIWMERSTSSFPNLLTDEEWSRIEKIYDLL